MSIPICPYLPPWRMLIFHIFLTFLWFSLFLVAYKKKSMFDLWLLYARDKSFIGYNFLDWVLNRFYAFPLDFLKVHEKPIFSNFFHMQFFSHNFVHSGLRNTSWRQQWLDTSHSRMDKDFSNGVDSFLQSTFELWLPPKYSSPLYLYSLSWII